jgi:hypothetical protein
VKFRLGLLLVFIVLPPAAFGGGIPGPGANQVFLFASPNTRESLSDKDAKLRMTSFEQINATAVADRAACALSDSVQIADSLGIYEKSSENSFILESDLPPEPSEYLAALLGLYSRQEFILLFREEPRGPDRLWIIKTPQSLEAAIATLRTWKITPVTVRMEKDQKEIWFIDPGAKHDALLQSFTSEVNGRASQSTGSAEILGSQDRAAAVRSWQRKISAFERRNEVHWSEKLTSKAWRNATAVHTCSTEMPNS